MRSKFAFITTVLVCAALAFAPVVAAERGVDRQGDRTKGGNSGSDAVDFRDTFGAESRVTRHESRMPEASMLAKASTLLSAAAKQDGPAAISTLNQILGLGIGSSVEGDRVIADVYNRLAGLYENPAKQVHMISLALAYEADPSNRTRLESRANALGGDVFAMAFNGNVANQTHTPGFADSCDDAVAVVQDFNSGFVLNIEPGERDWFSFTVNGPEGEFMRLETVSDTPGTFDDDTDMSLYGGCVAGAGDPFIAFNDDGIGVNAPFMSRIDTDCLTPGTYYVEIGGFANISFVDNFALEIATENTCILPVVDAYEPDNTRDLAASIGLPTSTSGNGWGRAKKEIQDRSIFPAMDRDHAEYKLTQNELVRMETGGTFPTFFNDFASAPLEGDSVLEVRYQTEKDYGGRCNEPDIGFINSCATDQDCIDVCGGSFPCNGAPLVDFPICMPYYFFDAPFGGGPAVGHQNPLAVNDDGGSGGALASSLVLCMPRTAPGSDSASVNGDWVVRVDPFSTSAIFTYQLLVKNEVSCLFEVEPNNDFAVNANPLTLGSVVHGIYDFSESNPFQDADWFSFDVDEELVVAFETFGYDSFACDTALRLAVGPDDAGGYFLLAEDDDGGTNWLSRLDVILPPANELLGNVAADADYLVAVTSFYLNPNFPYTLASASFALPDFHTEADFAGGCDTEGAVNTIGLGEEWVGTFDVACDFDAYKITLSENTYVSAATGGSGDTTMEFVDCGDDSVLACDDDGGAGLLSLIEGCVPPGDYCVRVRPFSTTSTFDYSLTVNGTAGCVPTSPPTMVGDGLYRCSTGFDTCP